MGCGHKPTSLARPEYLHPFDLPKHNKIAVSRHDGVAPGNDGGRQNMSILRISESRELARTFLVRFPGHGFHTKQRQDFLRLFPKAGELLPHDLQDLSLDILGDDESVLPAKRGQENPPLCS